MISSSPLFHPQVLHSQREKFAFPDDLNDRYQRFLPLLEEARNYSDPVTDLQVIHELFCEVLGYRSPFQSQDFWEIDFTDRITLGHFTSDQNQSMIEIIVSPIQVEIKFQTGIEWLIITDFYQISLYYKDYCSLFSQQLNFADFTDRDQLELFYFLFCRRNFLGNPVINIPIKPRLAKILDESLIIEQELMREFYTYLERLYNKLKKDINYRLQTGSDRAENTTRLLLYRLLLLTGIADRGLLPKELLQDAYNFFNPYISQPPWNNFRAVFSWIQAGNPSQNIAPIPIEYFLTDDTLDRVLHIGDELCRQMKEIEQFNLKDYIYPLLLAFILKNLFSPKSSTAFRKLLPWRNSKIVAASVETWNQLTKILELELVTTSAVFLEKWQLLQELILFDPNLGTGLRLFISFDFLKISYQKIHRILTNQKVEVAPIPTDQSILDQIYGLDPDYHNIEIAKLTFYLTMASPYHLHLECQPIEECSFRQNLEQAKQAQRLIYLS